MTRYYGDGCDMVISSRTPDGDPNCCQVCGKAVFIEPSSPLRDAPCPHCGCLLHFQPPDWTQEFPIKNRWRAKKSLVARLRVMKGSKAGKVIKISTSQFLIGREDGCALRINNDAISRRHCIVIAEENELIVRDLKSRNGTFVNEKQVVEDAVALHEGDVLRVGPLEFQVQLPLRSANG